MHRDTAITVIMYFVVCLPFLVGTMCGLQQLLAPGLSLDSVGALLIGAP